VFKKPKFLMPKAAICCQEELLSLQSRLKYQFKNISYLQTALTHPSFVHVVEPTAQDYERFEFLGDALLGAIVAKKCFDLFPDDPEGRLTDAKSFLAQGSIIVELATYYDLSVYIRMSPSERAQNSHHRPRILTCVFEAVIGAIFIDGGYNACQEFVLASYEKIFKSGFNPKNLSLLLKKHNPKGHLQEYVQGLKEPFPIAYRIVHLEGSDHERIYHAQVENHQTGACLGVGIGSSKKKAEEQAACAALEALGL